MRFSIFDDDGTMGAVANGTLTYSVAGSSYLGYSNANLTTFLRDNLHAAGIGVKSASVERTVAGGLHITGRVVIDWWCQSIPDSVKSEVQRAMSGFSESVQVWEIGRSGCKAPAVGSTATTTPKAKDAPAATPPVDPSKLTWEQWFKKHETPLMIGGGGLVLVLLMRR